jgi:transcriptional regulator with XRE-family HTH domain
MENLRYIISKNLVALRKNQKLTQAELADAIHYNDKTLSKWETGETEPSVEVLKALADFYQISIDDICNENYKINPNQNIKKQHHHSRLVISLLGVLTVWFIATSAFSLAMIYGISADAWLCFVYAVPLSCICAVVFNSLWGKAKYNYWIISILVWSIIITVFLVFLIKLNINTWPIFIIGVPAQIIIVLWSRLKK